MKHRLPLIALVLVVVAVGWNAYIYLLPDPIFPIPLSSVKPEQAGLIWQECELPMLILTEAYNSPSSHESLACFSHPSPTFHDDETVNSLQLINKTHIRLNIGEDVYEAQAHDLLALTVYTLYKNGSPLKSLISLGDTLWLHMLLSNVNGRIAWGIENDGPATLVYDGKDLRNLYGLDKAHGAYALAAKLIFVGEKDGKYFIVYDGQKVGPAFDRITIGYCCETALYTARGGQGRYQFRGMRDGKSYIVEISASPISPEETEQARSSLQTFFTLLHNGRYTEATRLFGGDYQTLRDANPDVPADEHALLLERACRQNGFVCLEIRAIVEQVLISPSEIRFTVEFATADGKLFMRGPCCGATGTEMPSISRFEYTLKKVGDAFLVQDLPVYVP